MTLPQTVGPCPPLSRLSTLALPVPLSPPHPFPLLAKDWYQHYRLLACSGCQCRNNRAPSFLSKNKIEKNKKQKLVPKRHGEQLFCFVILCVHLSMPITAWNICLSVCLSVSEIILNMYPLGSKTCVSVCVCVLCVCVCVYFLAVFDLTVGLVRWYEQGCRYILFKLIINLYDEAAAQKWPPVSF
jgi:hypothetical protein